MLVPRQAVAAALPDVPRRHRRGGRTPVQASSGASVPR